MEAAESTTTAKLGAQHNVGDQITLADTRAACRTASATTVQAIGVEVSTKKCNGVRLGQGKSDAEIHAAMVIIIIILIIIITPPGAR